MKKVIIGLIIVLGLIIGGVVFQTNEATKPLTIKTVTVDTKGVDYPAPEKLDDTKSDTSGDDAKAAESDLEIKENPVATIDVDGYGVMEFELFPKDTPQTVYNFIALAEEGFYDGLTFHRFVADFMIQGGDPEGTGTGGPGYTIKGEFPANGVKNPNKHEKGALAMARSTDMNSGGSQFYITVADLASQSQYDYMDTDYAVFGQIISGEEILDEIATDQAAKQ